MIEKLQTFLLKNKKKEMKENRLLVLLLLFVTSVFSQIKGKVIDEFNQPVPYVNIWVQGENIATTSEENGEFIIHTTPDKSLLFSSLGFEKKVVSAKEASIVKLEPTSYQLNEIAITKRRRNRRLEIGQIENTTLQAFDNGPRIDVKFFPYYKSYTKTKYLSKIALLTDCKIENASVKIRIYKADANGFPAEELLDKNLIVTVKKGIQTTWVNISENNIEFPTQGVFIGVEKLMIEKNRTEKGVAPNVLYSFVERESMFTYSGGIWNKKTTEIIKNQTSRPKVPEPAINLILTN